MKWAATPIIPTLPFKLYMPSNKRYKISLSDLLDDFGRNHVGIVFEMVTQAGIAPAAYFPNEE